MPDWIMTSTANQGEWFGPAYTIPTGSLQRQSVETRLYYLVRDAYTWSQLALRVITNNSTTPSTCQNRINLGNGSMSISIPAFATGNFEDLVNSDNLASGDLITYYAFPGDNSFECPWIGSTLNGDSHFFGTGSQETVVFNVVRYFSINGYDTQTDTETYTYYTFRTDATLRNMQILIRTNTLDGATTFRTRVNGGNGNQSVSIGAGLTGRFEDAVNDDAISAGDEVNYQMDTTASTVNNLLIGSFGVTSDSEARQIISNAPDAADTQASGLTRFYGLEGGLDNAAIVEADVQREVYFDFTGQNYCVNIKSNTLIAATTVHFRVNGGDGNMGVSVGAGLTGLFEDLVNTDNVSTGDLVDHEVITPGGGGVIGLGEVGFEQTIEGGQMPYNIAKTVAAMA